MYDLPCPNCGGELAFLEQYRRHYCYACGRYAPDGYGDHGAKACPTCGGLLSHIPQYDRYYCYRCNSYPPDDAVLVSRLEPAPSTVTPAPAEAPAVVAPAETSMQATSVVVAPLAEPTPQPQHWVEEEIPSDETHPAATRRPLDRDELLSSKKPLLMDLCKEYGLEPTGTKEELRERLLSYLDELEAEKAPAEIPVVETEEPAPTEFAGSAAETRDERPTGRPEPEVASDDRPRRDERVYAPPSRASAPVVTRPPIAAETHPAAPILVTVPETRAVAAEEPEAKAGQAEHPCPTCGGELTYISDYDRWYCYRCKAYAPARKSKFACPSCGARLRWIKEYERWWCDACRRYAPSDLPRPESAVARASSEVARPVARTAIAATTPVHRHRSPGSGIGLVGIGVVLFLAYELLVDLPALLAVNLGIPVTADIAFGLRFFAFVFVAIGAILGLSAVRDRR